MSSGEAMRFDATTAKLVSEIRKVGKAQRDLEKQIERTSAAGKKAGDQAKKDLDEQFKKSAKLLNKKEELKRQLNSIRGANKDAFGAQALDRIKQMAVGVGSITAAINAATAGFREFDAERKKSAGDIRAAEFPFSKLAQLAGGDQAKFGRLTAEARRFLNRGGAQNIGEASEIIFNLESAGALGEAGFFAKLGGIADVSQLSGAAAVLRNNFGAAEVGSFRGQVSKAFAASAPAPRVSAGEILDAAASSAASAKAFDLSDEEVLAGTSIIAEKTGSASIAGTQLNSLLASLIKQGLVESFKGQGLGAILAGVDAKNFATEAESLKFFGRQEARKGFVALSDREALAARTREIAAAERDDAVGGIIGSVAGDPAVIAARVARELQAQAADANEATGRRQLARDAALAAGRIGLRQRREGFNQRGDLIGDLGAFGTGVNEFIGGALIGGANFFGFDPLGGEEFLESETQRRGAGAGGAERENTKQLQQLNRQMKKTNPVGTNRNAQL